MSYWIELHCDANVSPTCSGLNHDNPMTGCATVEQGRGIVLADAKRRGWKKIRGSMHCKACANFVATEAKGASDAQ